jgi:hypothetical protein
MNRLLELNKIVAVSSVVLGFGCFCLSPLAQAQGCPSNCGQFDGNTAMGIIALASNTTGNSNTAVGNSALTSNTTGSNNTANGNNVLVLNTTGSANTAIGDLTLYRNSTGNYNMASGFRALWNNRTGNFNTAIGAGALLYNTGEENTATGAAALLNNTTGDSNTGAGSAVLYNNTTGAHNTANGYQALSSNTTGSDNIALGDLAGSQLTTGDNNIDIGNVGVAADSAAIRLGTVGTQTKTFIAGINGAAVTGASVFVNNSGQLGTATSSRRFKDEIEPMNKASEALFALEPVTFRYKKEIDPVGTQQFGLVAEEVEKVNPALVVRDKEGKPYTVRYDQVNAMLLNEFLKEHKAFIEERRKVEKLEATVAQQHKQFEAAVAEVKGQIERVSAQLQLSKAAPQTALNNH